MTGTRITEYEEEIDPALSIEGILRASDPTSSHASPGQLQTQRMRRETKQKRFYHPTLGLMEELPTLSTNMTRGARIGALSDMAAIYQFSSITDSTKHEYLVGWRHYTNSFCEGEMECCPYFTRPYAEYQQQGPIPYPTQLVILFYVWLREVRKVQPGTAASYISAVRFMIKNSGIDDKCFDHAMLGVTKTGGELLYRGDHPEVESKKLPIKEDTRRKEMFLEQRRGPNGTAGDRDGIHRTTTILGVRRHAKTGHPTLHPCGRRAIHNYK
jgi:hypothetical protein